MLGMLLPAWVKPAAIASCLALAALWAWSWHTGRIDEAVKAVHAEYTAAALVQVQAAAETTRILRRAADKIQGENNAEIQNQRARTAELIASLRNRADRPEPDAGDSSPARNCTGAGLYRPDAEFLVWFAGEAARVKAERDSCEAQYGEVKSRLNAL